MREKVCFVALPILLLFLSSGVPCEAASAQAPTSGRLSPPPRSLQLRPSPPPSPAVRLRARPWPVLLPAAGQFPRPREVRGIYVTGWVAGSPTRFRSLVELVDKTELNTMVIDIKDDQGTLTYRSSVPLAVELGQSRFKVQNIRELLSLLYAHRIYPIARLVVFKDNVLPRRYPELAVQDERGRVWQDKKGLTWTDPYNRRVWEYNVELAKEAAALGFREIQFDYVRFPDVPRNTTLIFPAQDGRSKVEVIQGFLRYARQELRPYGVKVTADIFGLVTTAQDDMGIGQRLEELAEVVDYLHPMVYPSHYAPGEYGLADPDAVPYTTVKLSLSDALHRLSGRPGSARIIPWLQDFSLYHVYGPAEVRAQIKAAQELGLNEWFLWNPRNEYTVTALQPRRVNPPAALDLAARPPSHRAPYAPLHR